MVADIKEFLLINFTHNVDCIKYRFNVYMHYQIDELALLIHDDYITVRDRYTLDDFLYYFIEFRDDSYFID